MWSWAPDSFGLGDWLHQLDLSRRMEHIQPTRTSWDQHRWTHSVEMCGVWITKDFPLYSVSTAILQWLLNSASNVQTVMAGNILLHTDSNQTPVTKLATRQNI